MSQGIYQIVHTESKRFYLGSSQNIEKRWGQHKSDLRANRHHCVYLQRAWNKYGEEAFQFSILELTNLPREREQVLLDQLKEQLFNTSTQASGGDLISYHPNRDDIVLKISKASKERILNMSEEERALKFGRKKEANPNFGNHWTTEQKVNASIKHKGKTHSKETKQKMKLAQQARWTDEARKAKSESILGDANHFFGKSHTEETKSILREKSKGRLPPNIRQVSVDGQVYPSLTEAARQLSVVPATILYRIGSINPKFKDYFYVQQNLARDNLVEGSPV